VERIKQAIERNQGLDRVREVVRSDANVLMLQETFEYVSRRVRLLKNEGEDRCAHACLAAPAPPRSLWELRSLH